MLADNLFRSDKEHHEVQREGAVSTTREVDPLAPALSGTLGAKLACGDSPAVVSTRSFRRRRCPSAWPRKSGAAGAAGPPHTDGGGWLAALPGAATVAAPWAELPAPRRRAGRHGGSVPAASGRHVVSDDLGALGA